jgi:hypothetical protein
MIRLLASIALVLGSACTAHAHTPTPTHAPVVRHSTPAPAVTVSAWVWVSGHYRSPGIWMRGQWVLRSVPRHMLSRHPHTHVRHVQGRHQPHQPPARRHRRQH